jgi:hypothetical protein
MAAKARVSIVVIARNEGAELRNTVENLEATRPDSTEIIVVDDGSEDGSADFLTHRRAGVRGPSYAPSRSRTRYGTTARGALAARFWFSPTHISALTGLVGTRGASSRAASVRGGRTGSAKHGTDRRGRVWADIHGARSGSEVAAQASERPFEAPILPGCFPGYDARYVRCGNGGWDDGLLQRGGVDNELSVRLWLLGLPPADRPTR